MYISISFMPLKHYVPRRTKSRLSSGRICMGVALCRAPRDPLSNSLESALAFSFIFIFFFLDISDPLTNCISSLTTRVPFGDRAKLKFAQNHTFENLNRDPATRSMRRNEKRRETREPFDESATPWTHSENSARNRNWIAD
jgi:hypothetical protein